MTNQISWVWLLTLLTIGIAPALIRRWDVGRLVADIIDDPDLRLPRKVAASLMGIGEPQLSRMLSGAGPEQLSLDRLTALPDAFWLRFIVRLGEQFHVLPSADSRVERLARVECRMVRASLRQEAVVRCA